MTIIFFKVSGDTFILRKIFYDSTTDTLDVKLEAVETGIQTIFKCFKESEHYSFRRSLQESSIKRKKKPKTNYLNGYKDQMTTIFLEIINESYLLEHLTYNSETKVFTVLTERVGDWEKVNFKCPKSPRHNSFIKSLYFNPPPRNIKSINKVFE